MREPESCITESNQSTAAAHREGGSHERGHRKPRDPGTTLQQASRDWDTLLGIALDALRISPPLYVSSIFGLPWTWLPPFSRYSEFKIIDLWRPGRTAKFLANTWIPSIPRTPPTFGPPFLNELFWQPTVILQRPDHNGSYTTFPDEAWFFVNGIMTNDSVAQINSAYLAYLFHRPLTMIQNSTDSLWIDLFECALGKEWYRVVEPAIKAFPPIYDALKSPHKQRVVVICHSQGTIIMSVVLRLLGQLIPPLPRPRWKPKPAPRVPCSRKRRAMRRRSSSIRIRTRSTSTISTR